MDQKCMYLLLYYFCIDFVLVLQKKVCTQISEFFVLHFESKVEKPFPESTKLKLTFFPYGFVFLYFSLLSIDFPGGSDGKASAYNEGDVDSIPGSGRSSGEGNGNPLQYSCLENPMDERAWQATVCGVAKSRTRLRDFTLPSVQFSSVSQSCLTL